MRGLPGNALLSVYDKTGLDRIAWILSKLQVKMLGSGGTAEAVRKLGLTVVDVSEYTGVKEMPGGLVKTLHPKIHGGILGDWRDPVQREYLEANGIEPLDFVVVNLYPFQSVVKTDPSNLRKAVDNIDIGGVTLMKKGYVGNELRQRLAREAFALTAEYDRAIRDYLAGQGP